MELTRERGDLDMKRMHAENELRQCQHARQNLEMENDVLQRDIASLRTQLDDKSEGLRQSWKDANAKASLAEQSYQQIMIIHLLTQLGSSNCQLAMMHVAPTMIMLCAKSLSGASPRLTTPC